MQVLGLCGCTPERAVDLATAVLPALRARGLTVSVLLAGPPDFDLDRPGKDSFEHRSAGALEVAISSTQRWALLHEDCPSAAPQLNSLIARLDPVDLLLVLGFDDAGLKKAGLKPVEVRAGLEATDLAATILAALAADNPTRAQQV
ncbi:MAG TPA: molybdopterin-guanine dinucleotide biosynthesis protein MobB [Kiloniellaceae bacterium]|nr:molybdopterin-guanine dinucleotide biosynthesis protein MobB [Kiloniellaceae bacterium]